MELGNEKGCPQSLVFNAPKVKCKDGHPAAQASGPLSPRAEMFLLIYSFCAALCQGQLIVSCVGPASRAQENVLILIYFNIGRKKMNIITVNI